MFDNLDIYLVKKRLKHDKHDSVKISKIEQTMQNLIYSERLLHLCHVRIAYKTITTTVQK